MFVLMVLFLCLISLDYIECKSLSQFCTDDKRDYEVNILQSVFTIRNKVYIRVGTDFSKYWIYDIQLNQLQTEPVLAVDLFKDYYPIVENVAAVLCPKCPPNVDNLLIAIGRKNLQSYRTFATFRIQSDDSLVRIKNKDQLPPDWKLKTEGEFSLDAEPYWGFFPEDVVTIKTNYSNFHAFTYFPPKKIFILKYYNENRRYFLYRKLYENGVINDWLNLTVIGDYQTHNSLFPMNHTIYAINNDPAIMPRISSKIRAEEQNGVIQFMSEEIDIEARKFFNCFDDPIVTTTQPSTESSQTPSKTPSEALSKTTSELPPKVPSQTSFEIPSETTTSSLSTTTALTSKDTTETSETSIAMSESTEIEFIDEEEDNIAIWIIIFFIILIMLCLIMITILILYLRKRGEKGQKYSTNEKEGSKRNLGLAEPESVDSRASLRSEYDKKPKDGINSNQKNELQSSPSMASMRSNRNKSPNAMNFNEMRSSPSMASMRSNRSKSPNSMNFNEMGSSPSMVSMRSNRNKSPNAMNFNEMGISPSMASMRSNRNEKNTGIQLDE